MVPKFIMHAGYKTRTVELVLSRERNGWKFYGRDVQGYLIPARNQRGEMLGDNVTCTTREEAALMARNLELPAYAVWNGRKRCYDGKGAEFVAVARDAL